MSNAYEVLDKPVILDFLQPETIIVEQEALYIDTATGKIIPSDVMTEYNRYYGLAGFDEADDDWGDCGDE